MPERPLSCRGPASIQVQESAWSGGPWCGTEAPRNLIIVRFFKASVKRPGRPDDRPLHARFIAV